MNCFGYRADFAVEVGDCVDFRGHFTLDFYMRDVHLNHADNEAYLPLASGAFPRPLACPGGFRWMDVNRELPISVSPESLLSRVIVEDELRFWHATLGLGPVTDSFSLFTFARPNDVLLLCLRNDHFGSNLSDLDRWNVTEGIADDPVHWLTVNLVKPEYFRILREAAQAIDRLAWTKASTLDSAKAVGSIWPLGVGRPPCE